MGVGEREVEDREKIKDQSRRDELKKKEKRDAERQADTKS
jgi:hypothetical protein